MVIESATDRVEAHGAEVDGGPLLGTWINTNRATRQIAGVRIGREDRRYSLIAWGASEGTSPSWGSLEVDRLYHGRTKELTAVAFVAGRHLGGLDVRLETNLSKGLLIIACLKRFRDGSGRSDYFVREFFRSAGDAPPPGLAEVAGGARPVTCPGDEPAAARPRGGAALESSLYLGRWENTDLRSNGILEATFLEEAGAVRLGVRLADASAADGGWAFAAPEWYADGVDGTAATQFAARLESTEEILSVHGWVKLGVLVFAVFRHGKGSGPESATFDRDFLYQMAAH